MNKGKTNEKRCVHEIRTRYRYLKPQQKLSSLDFTPPVQREWKQKNEIAFLTRWYTACAHAPLPDDPHNIDCHWSEQTLKQNASALSRARIEKRSLCDYT